MSKLELEILLIYIVGIFVYMLIDKRIFTEEDDDGDNTDCAMRSFFWPLFAALLIFMLPIYLLSRIASLIDEIHTDKNNDKL